MLTEQDQALKTTIEQESQALAELLTTPDRSVMVIVIVAHNNGVVDHAHAIGGDPTGRHAYGFMRGVQEKYNWIAKGLARMMSEH